MKRAVCPCPISGNENLLAECKKHKNKFTPGVSLYLEPSSKIPKKKCKECKGTGIQDPKKWKQPQITSFLIDEFLSFIRNILYK